MPDSAVAITAGSGTNIDTFTQANGEHRQAVVLGDATAANVATVNAAGELLVNIDSSSAGARTSVAGTVTEGQLLAANANRVTLTVWNNSSAILYLGLGAGVVTATDCTVPVGPGLYYEAPSRYTGVVRGVWGAANGNAVLTELSA